MRKGYGLDDRGSIPTMDKIFLSTPQCPDLLWGPSSLLPSYSCLQPPAHAGSPLEDFSTLKMEAICSSETSVDARSTQRHIPEDDILNIYLFVYLFTELWEYKWHRRDVGKPRTRNTTWTPYIKIAWGKCKRTFWNTTTCSNNIVILKCESVQCGDFLQLIVAWWWPREAETCSKKWHFKCRLMNFNCNYKWHLK
jgi:hypothetical protein